MPTKADVLLSPEQVEECKHALALAQSVKARTDMMESCDIDCRAEAAAADALIERLTKLLDATDPPTKSR